MANHNDTGNHVAADSDTVMPGDDGFSVWCENLEGTEGAMEEKVLEFLSERGGIVMETPSEKGEDKRIQDIFITAIQDSDLLEDEFEEFLRDKYEGG